MGSRYSWAVFFGPTQLSLSLSRPRPRRRHRRRRRRRQPLSLIAAAPPRNIPLRRLNKGELSLSLSSNWTWCAVPLERHSRAWVLGLFIFLVASCCLVLDLDWMLCVFSASGESFLGLAKPHLLMIRCHEIRWVNHFLLV